MLRGINSLLKRVFYSWLQAVLLAFSIILMLTSTAVHAQGSKYAAFVADADTGEVLHQDGALEPRYPASLTKMMTLYILFEELKRGRVGLNSEFTVSKNAAAQPPSKLGLKAGSRIKVEDAILALAVKSSNDIAVVIAESLSGSEAKFAQRMTSKARELGMTSTIFQNASGLPNERQITTAYDMFKLGRALEQNFPQYFPYFGVKNWKYGKSVMQNHNKLLGNFKGIDGIKTGYTKASGYNLVSSLRYGNRHFIGVVLGGESGAWRDKRMADLLRITIEREKGSGGEMLVAKADLPPISISRTAFQSEYDRRQQALMSESEEAEHDSENVASSQQEPIYDPITIVQQDEQEPKVIEDYPEDTFIDAASLPDYLFSEVNTGDGDETHGIDAYGMTFATNSVVWHDQEFKGFKCDNDKEDCVPENVRVNPGADQNFFRSLVTMSE